MSETTERRTVFSVGEKIIRVNIIDGGNAVEVFSVSDCMKHHKGDVKGTQEYIEKYFPVVKASTLSLEDDFLKHEPESYRQSELKERLIKAIKSELSDFRVQRMDPSLDENGHIFYKADMKPATDENIEWWKENAKEFLPQKRSRIGTRKERTAFCGLLIKYLIENQGYTESEAWKAVCDQSKDLGHYKDSKSPKYDFEPTGSRRIGDWYDLGNTFKIIIDDETGDILFVGGACAWDCNGNDCPLVYEYKSKGYNEYRYGRVAWIVMDV